MREQVKDPVRLSHMLEAAVILRDRAPLHSLEGIKEDPILFFGLAKLVEIIGEAAYKLTQAFKDSHTEVPWRAIVGMRHVMVHDYYAKSAEKIWATIITDIPDLIPYLERYVAEFDTPQSEPEGKEAAYKATWEEAPREDEIARQQAMKERLKPGLEVVLKDFGKFRYSGIWDTMHTFYPVEGQILREMLPGGEQRYIRRDLRGQEFIELPYTRLADYVKIEGCE